MYHSIFSFWKHEVREGSGLPFGIVFYKTVKFQREICLNVEMSLYGFCVNAPWNVVLKFSFKVYESVSF